MTSQERHYSTDIVVITESEIEDMLGRYMIDPQETKKDDVLAFIRAGHKKIEQLVNDPEKDMAKRLGDHIDTVFYTVNQLLALKMLNTYKEFYPNIEVELVSKHELPKL
jgi:hypothetical protein